MLWLRYGYGLCRNYGASTVIQLLNELKKKVENQFTVYY